MKRLNQLLQINFTRVFFSLAILCAAGSWLSAQAVPGEEENIPFLVTFGAKAPTYWGDDDHVQIYFLIVPTDYSSPIYFRIFDPDVGGMHDEAKSGFDTRTRYSIFGGKGAYSHPDAREMDPVGEYDSGNLIQSKTFGESSEYDNKWYTFPPINPKEGELSEAFGKPKFVFKIICEGISGDDGNLYRYYFSAKPDKNVDIEGGDTFTFEYTFRLAKGTSHIYPYMDKEVTAIKQFNFDYDSDGFMKLVSPKRPSERVMISTDGEWAQSYHPIYEEEKDKVMDIQIISLGRKNNNNVVFYVLNQYGKAMPFYNFPIGLVPRENKIIVIPD